jgi:2-polyprenyl-3-methyl-5-hydroxy-6-metoxy-1,4-benzoquinol methylase
MKIEHLDSGYIKKKLARQFNTQINVDLEIIDYDLMKCSDCSFEFAFPLVEGSASFYNWITSQPNYYTETRWEYSKMIDLLSKEKGKLKLLDVGCGDGQFFDRIVKNKNLNVAPYGLDPTIGSVDICKSKGHNAFCMTVQEFKSFYNESDFDVVTAYHVLEHIADPKNFLTALTDLINPAGAVYISTPYSPMDFELEWYDVLNHPPHHMGRWNLKSYKKIAEVLGLEMEVFMPEATSFVKSAITSFLFSIYGPVKTKAKIKILKGILKHPFKFMNHLLRQSMRSRISGKRTSNVILVKLKKCKV